MRLLLMLAACVAIASGQETETNMSCVERLQMPLYPRLAQHAGISGQVTVRVSISTDSAVNMESDGPHMLVPYVERALRASTFRKTCGGKVVQLVFNFDFDEDPYKAVSFRYPNEFFITVPHAPVNP